MTTMRTYRVATFWYPHERRSEGGFATGYLLDYSLDWPGLVICSVEAKTGRQATAEARRMRKDAEMRTLAMTADPRPNMED